MKKALWDMGDMGIRNLLRRGVISSTDLDRAHTDGSNSQDCTISFSLLFLQHGCQGRNLECKVLAGIVREPSLLDGSYCSLQQS